MNGRACSDTLLHVLDRAYERPMADEERAAMPFAGGILQHGYQCGMLWGAALAAGAQAYRRLGPGPRAEARAIVASQRVVESFRALTGEINCLEITHLDKSSTTMQMVTYFLLKGGTIGCFRMAARYAPIAFREIDAALAEAPGEAPAAPVSCAAMVTERMGASPMQTVMAAGLAGGIGLCGGACGALGAAIWVLGLKTLERGADKLEFKAPGALELIDRFLRCNDFELECSAIVGRQFESVGDHACHLRNGGCAKVIETLVASGVEIADRE
ncbi:MAG: C-GCAxxG-C-C family protein [Thermoanaerobaculaceae bacterium]|jgi:hypothetical protein|nr:C-GCAxxG-C-C family protein [Thermoanaerobaculaceae bacterium]